MMAGRNKPCSRAEGPMVDGRGAVVGILLDVLVSSVALLGDHGAAAATELADRVRHLLRLGAEGRGAMCPTRPYAPLIWSTKRSIPERLELARDVAERAHCWPTS